MRGASALSPDELAALLGPRRTQEVDSPVPGTGSVAAGSALVLSIELGGADVPLAELPFLGTDDIVKLDTSLGQPVTICVNRKPVAQGEVLVERGQLVVRVTCIISRSERAALA